MRCRNDTDDGVRLLTRLEKCAGPSGAQVRALCRSWVSISAMRRLEVAGDDPVGPQISVDSVDTDTNTDTDADADILSAANSPKPAGPPPTHTTS